MSDDRIGHREGGVRWYRSMSILRVLARRPVGKTLRFTGFVFQGVAIGWLRLGPVDSRKGDE